MNGHLQNCHVIHPPGAINGSPPLIKRAATYRQCVKSMPARSGRHHNNSFSQQKKKMGKYVPLTWCCGTTIAGLKQALSWPHTNMKASLTASLFIALR